MGAFCSTQSPSLTLLEEEGQDLLELLARVALERGADLRSVRGAGDGALERDPELLHGGEALLEPRDEFGALLYRSAADRKVARWPPFIA
jgi:hypothetical protein